MPLSEQEYEERKALAVKRHVIDMAKLRGQALPQAFLFGNAIPKQGITFISGPPGGAKSWVAYDACLRTVRCEAWLGRPYLDADETTHGALILNYDNPTPLMAQRFVQLDALDTDPLWFHTMNVDDPNAKQINFPTDESDDSMAHIEELKMIVSELRPKVILIDSFRQAHDGDENDSKQIACVMRHIKRLLAFRATVLVIHHCTKSGPGLRGTGEIDASADAHISITGEPGSRQAFWQKHRGWAMPMKYQAVTFDVRDRGKDADRRTFIEVIT